MKRLGVFCMSTLLCIGFLLAATPSIVRAQSIDRITAGALPSQGTYDYFYSKGTAVFTETIAALTKVKDGINASSASNKQTASASIDEYIKLITDTQSAYTQAFNTAQSQAVSPVDAQIRAIQAGRAKYQEGFTAFSPQTKQEPLAQSVVRIWANKFDGTGSLLTEAMQIKNGSISAGSTAAGELGNATPITQGGASVAKIAEDPNQCAFIGGNLLGCIDQLVASLIKNTLLRIAGVVLWLCANMLDFAMNIGILQFSKWAPPALYDIWIVVRQITSLAIVFAGLYLGFMYIIGKTDTFGKYIGWVIIFALFVNFSYPLTRMLIDVSNIVSLNVYSSAIPSGLTGTGSSAGTEIMNRLGLQALVNSATDQPGTTDIYKSITSTPVALVTVAFVAYAAYIFFMATAIIATRTAVLVFLTIGSPLLLIDSVVPKLGEVASKMRKMFFEQLVVAPVFVIMLAITLKFMTVFRTLPAGNTPGGPLSTIGQDGVSVSSLAGTAGGSVTLFFSVLMMLVMLHIMLKVTRSLAGEAGNYATNFMGKVGGFGLAAATGGAGLLARGTIGAKAMQFRDSPWMDKMKDTTMGRGLYGLSNSLAQSTFDARNIGMVSRGMATAGLTGGLGLTMQGGTKGGFETQQQARQKRVVEFGSNIRDDATRGNYLTTANRFRLTKVDAPVLDETMKKTQSSKDDQVQKMLSTTSKDERETLINQALIGKDYALVDKLRQADQFHSLDNKDAATPQKKAELLKKMGITDVEKANKFIEKDAFKDLTEAHEKKIKEMELDLGGMKNNTAEEKAAYDAKRTEIGTAKREYANDVAQKKQATRNAFMGSPASVNQQTPSQGPSNDPRNPSPPSEPLNNPPKNPPGDDEGPLGVPPAGTPPTRPLRSGGSAMAEYGTKEFETPAYRRAGAPEPSLQSVNTAAQTSNTGAQVPQQAPVSAGSGTTIIPPRPIRGTMDAPVRTGTSSFMDSSRKSPSEVTVLGTSFKPEQVKIKSFTSYLKGK